jgi:hypothetical protein
MLSWTRKIEQTKYLMLIIVAIGVVIRLVSIPVFANAPHSPVDVYYVDNQAARIILDLKNPYSQGLVVHDYVLNQFPYLPFVAIYYAPFYLLGDIRFGNIFADTLIMFSIYWIARSINRGAAFFAPLTYALLPFSIWLTSVASTNIMIGASFLTVSTAALLNKKYLVTAIFLGLALATNQLVVLALPLFIFYFWGKRKFSYFLGSFLFSAGIILPFFITDPFRFIYDVVLFQFERPPQIDGPFSIYSIIYSTTGQAISPWIRVALFLVVVLIAVIWFKRKTFSFVPLMGGLLLLGAFILPVNGFWNYFLPAATFICALIPFAIDEVTSKIEKSAFAS